MNIAVEFHHFWTNFAILGIRHSNLMTLLNFRTLLTKHNISQNEVWHMRVGFGNSAIEFFTISLRYKSANIANFVLALLLELN